MAVNVVPARAASEAPRERIVPKHHALVRITHWLNVPLLLLMAASGLSIYWASPVFRHAPSPSAPRGDWFQSIGTGKRSRLVAAAQLFLMQTRSRLPCRFDVVAIEDGKPQWLRAAFSLD